MPSIDFPLEKLREYKPPLNHQSDFDAFWARTLKESEAQPLNAELHPYPVSFKGLRAYKVFFEGYKGARIACHYVRPDTKQKVPGLAIYHGYSGRAPRPVEMLHYAHAGIATLSMDCRGQNGDSTDGAIYPEGHAPGWMTLGIRSPETYYYRYVYCDAVRALEFLAAQNDVDTSRLGVTGISQGGGISIAAAALSARPILCQPDIPFLCDFKRAVQITPQMPYPEIVAFLKQYSTLEEQVFRTLSYFDGMNLAPRIKARTVISNGLMDDICPPSTIFAAYNHISAPKEMVVYPYHKHDVTYEQNEVRYKLLMEVLKP
jgi:cephalosporin-C deacetylase